MTPRSAAERVPGRCRFVSGLDGARNCATHGWSGWREEVKTIRVCPAAGATAPMTTDLDALAALLAAATPNFRNINFGGMLFRRVPSAVADALPSLMETAREAAGLRAALEALVEDHDTSTHDTTPGERLRDWPCTDPTIERARALLRDSAGASERGAE